ncbi:hypothetical protein [Rubinisphaera italica]|uniref:PsbP C-terminal domain-containing protein n=1 Tax=Rubinisphaera italica TaxID=2527969 RepID=A0A5C5XLA3_9PLAN|nr:hypothetical protein [Rubinisphaera italica]TWT62925.1 hypothetical protein Pan54_36760 [Rubinisphaera italica]
MQRLSSSLLIFSLMLVGLANTAFCEDYRDKSGFSFTHPTGWLPINGSLKSELIDGGITDTAKDYLKKQSFDFEKIKVLLIRNGQDDFLENVNVVVIDSKLPATQEFADLIVKILPQQYKQMGMKVDNFKSKIQTFGSNKGVIVDQRMNPSETVPNTLKQRQFYMASQNEDKSYIITYTATPETFRDHVKTYEEILKSFAD